MEMTRRAFGGWLGKGSLLAVLSQTLWFTGCSVYTDILNYVGIGLQAFQGVLSLLGNFIPGSAVLSALIPLIKAGFADVQTDVNAYEAAPAADKATLAGKVSLALSILVMNLQQFWSDVHIPDTALEAVIQGALTLILSVLAGFQKLLPPAPASFEQTEKLKALTRRLTFSPVKMSSSQFQKQFNAILTGGGYPAVRFYKKGLL